MKLEYNILWIDDKIDTPPYKSVVKNVKEHVNLQFFKCDTIEVAEDFDEFKSKFRDDLEYDLIITDLSLNNGTTGAQIIDFVRNTKNNGTEILFYSADTRFRETNLINSNRITFYQLTEGSYKELESEIIEVINLTIKKFQNIVAMRGMIMHETSSLDVEFKDILKSIIENKPDGLALEKIKKRFKKFNSDSNAEIDEIAELDSLLLKIGASHRWKGLKENVENGNIKDILKFYEDEIITIRNKFAHAVLEEDKNGRNYFKDKSDGVDFNNEKCKTIRENIIRHKQNLDNLKKLI